MKSKAVSKLTKAERREARELARRGRSNTLRPGDQERIFELFDKDPEGYGEASKEGRQEADAAVNPLLKRKTQ